MTLSEIIKLKLDSLNDDYEKLKQNKAKEDELVVLRDDIAVLQDFLNHSYNMVYLKDFDFNLLLQILLKNSFSKYRKLEEEFRIISLVLMAKYGKQMDVDLTDEQNNYMRNLRVDCNDLEKSVNTSILEGESLLVKNECNMNECSDVISKFEGLFEKVLQSNFAEVLTEDDFMTFYKIILDENISDEIKEEALIKFRQYNDECVKNFAK